MVRHARRRRAPAFTLVELLVVLVIVLLVSAVTLPAIVPALSHRQVSEGARIVQGQLVQARDTAIRYNAPRGVRFLPDPTYANSPSIMAYNRMVPIEPGPDYSNGMATIWPAMYSTAGPWPWNYTTGGNTPFPPPYPTSAPVPTYGGPSGSVYPLNPPITAGNPTSGQCLMLEQAPFQGNDASQFINAPTSWFWNIRIGDRLQINGSGQVYTVVGPCTINPWRAPSDALFGNPELFVNVGLPVATINQGGQPTVPPGYLARTYTDSQGNPGQPVAVEYLLLVNGLDDDQDGYVDNGWDGVDNNRGYVYNAVTDDQGNEGSGGAIKTEWEVETWKGTLFGAGGQPVAPYNGGGGYKTTDPAFLPPPMNYTIFRRPVPTQSARETMLPNNVVIDATTWNSANPERSRLPVDPFSHYVDILLLPSGQVVPTTLYSSPSSFGVTSSFYHFWIAERQDVHELTDLWGPGGNPNAGLSFLLPMPQDAYNAYSGTWTTTPSLAYKGDRMLVTLFSRTGNLTTNSIEYTGVPGDPGWDVTNVSAPYVDAQLGTREAH